MSVQDTCQAMKFLFFLIFFQKINFFFQKINFFFKKLIFFSKNFKNCHVSVYHRATWQLTSMTRDGVIVVFNLVPQFKFLVQFSTPIF